MIYITGDMHGDKSRFQTDEIKKLQAGDTLIICGDFGFVWDSSKEEKKFLKTLGEKPYNICFVDGPHDNYDQIYSARKTVWKGGMVHRISGKLFHMCRGQVFSIEGKKIFTFGGGESLDKEIRTDSQIWFKEELPTPEEMMEGAQSLEENGLSVDYIVTHEPPSIVKSALQYRANKINYVNKLNGYLEEINSECQYKRWFFGSIHEDRIITKKHTSVFKKLINIESDPTTLMLD